MRLPSSPSAASALACMLALVAATPVHAIMAGSASGVPPDAPADRVDPNITRSTWAGVGSLSVGARTYSAVAIGRRYVLTAGHVAKGANPANVKFNLNFGGDLTQRIRSGVRAPRVRLLRQP